MAWTKARASCASKLSESGNLPDKNGLTKAGRALQKHGGREDSVFPKVTGHENLNSEGQNFLKGIVDNPMANFSSNKYGGFDAMTPYGGARFNTDKDFMGFLEPSK